MSSPFSRDLGRDTYICAASSTSTPVRQRLRQTSVARSRTRKMARRCDGVPLFISKTDYEWLNHILEWRLMGGQVLNGQKDAHK